MICFDHVNFNVFDLQKSIAFYKEAFGLEIVREIDGPDGAFKLVFLGDNKTGFRLELTWLRDRTEKYDLGEQEFHLAFVTDEFEATHKKHKDMNAICYENAERGLYFVEDPDGYWLEILPKRG